jgi:ribonucleoside-triphosphate reductase
VYSRVVGYYSPVSQWNVGKQQEYKERQAYKTPERIELDKRSDVHKKQP